MDTLTIKLQGKILSNVQGIPWDNDLLPRENYSGSTSGIRIDFSEDIKKIKFFKNGGFSLHDWDQSYISGMAVAVTGAKLFLREASNSYLKENKIFGMRWEYEEHSIDSSGGGYTIQTKKDGLWRTLDLNKIDFLKHVGGVLYSGLNDYQAIIGTTDIEKAYIDDKGYSPNYTIISDAYLEVTVFLGNIFEKDNSLIQIQEENFTEGKEIRLEKDYFISLTELGPRPIAYSGEYELGFLIYNNNSGICEIPASMNLSSQNKPAGEESTNLTFKISKEILNTNEEKET